MSYCIGKHTYHHRTPTVYWRKDDKQEEHFAECRNCGELTKPSERYCSMFCRIEHQQQDK